MVAMEKLVGEAGTVGDADGAAGGNAAFPSPPPPQADSSIASPNAAASPAGIAMRGDPELGKQKVIKAGQVTNSKMKASPEAICHDKPEPDDVL